MARTREIADGHCVAAAADDRQRETDRHAEAQKDQQHKTT